MENKIIFFTKVIIAQGIAFALSSLLVSQVFMGQRPILRPDLKERAALLPVIAGKYTGAVYETIVSAIKSLPTSQKNEKNPQTHVPPPWVFEPPPQDWLPTSSPTSSYQQPTQPPPQPTSNFRLPTFFPRQPTSTSPSQQPTQPSQPTAQPRPTSMPTQKPTDAPPPSSEGDNNLEQQVLQLVNQNRSNLGLFTVQMNENLRAAARRHSADLNKKGCIGHQGSDGSWPPDRARAAGYSGGLVGETIGCLHSNANSIVDGWMHSPGHKAILMDSRARLIGIGWVGKYQTAVVGY